MLESNQGEASDLINNEEEVKGQEISRRDFLKLSGVLMSSALIPKNVLNFANELDTNQSESALFESASSFVSKTPEQARFVSEALMWKGADASTICGPLSTAIMADWRLQKDGSIKIGNNGKVNGLIPEDLWLASPRGESTSPKMFSYVFPEDKYDRYIVSENIRTLDFNNIPEIGQLKPGDFLYLDGGSFTHFLTISRQGKEGEIYATTNIPSETGKFIIEEVMLWNPKTKDGFFRDFAQGIGPEIAYTGRKGFYMWREKNTEKLFLNDPSAEEFRNNMVNKMREQNKGKWNISISDLQKGKLFEWREGMIYHPASTIKVPIAIGLMQSIKSVYGDDINKIGLEEVLRVKGFERKSFEQLLRTMLVHSEEEATESCVRFIEQKMPIKKKFKELGLNDTTYLPRESSQRDLSKSWMGLFNSDYVDLKERDYLLKLLSEHTENDDILLGSIRRVFPDAKQWNKRGAVVQGSLYTMQDTGIIEINGRAFYIGIAGNSVANFTITDLEMQEFIEGICYDFTKYIAKTENNRKGAGRKKSSMNRE